MSKSTRTPLKSTKRQKLRLPRKSIRRKQLRTTRLKTRRLMIRRLTSLSLAMLPPLTTRKKLMLKPKHLLRQTKLQHPKPRLTISDFVSASCKVICKVSWRNLKL